MRARLLPILKKENDFCGNHLFAEKVKVGPVLNMALLLQ